LSAITCSSTGVNPSFWRWTVQAAAAGGLAVRSDDHALQLRDVRGVAKIYPRIRKVQLQTGSQPFTCSGRDQSRATTRLSRCW
jgi:hypothetical protein